MGKMKIKLNKRNVRALMKSQEVADMLEHKAYQVRHATGHPDDYAVSTYAGKNRVNASVFIINDEAMKRNKRIGGNELLKALGSVKE